MRNDIDAGAASSREGSPARLPGAWQAAAIAAIAALLTGTLGRPGDSARRAAARSDISSVAEVVPGDLQPALGTVSGTPQQLAEMARDACGRRLAWVTVVRAPGQPSGRIRLRSGSYISPAFDLLESPVRIAIPFPAPYPTGHGTIAALGATTDAVVALNPPWHVPAQGGIAVRDVAWTPTACSTAGK